MDRGAGSEAMAKKMATAKNLLKYQRLVAFFVFIVNPYLTLVSDEPGYLFLISELYYLGCTIMGIYMCFICALPAISAMKKLIGGE